MERRSLRRVFEGRAQGASHQEIEMNNDKRNITATRTTTANACHCGTDCKCCGGCGCGGHTK